MVFRLVGVLVGMLLVLPSAFADAMELRKAERSKDDVMNFALDFRKAILERNMPYLRDVTTEGGGIDKTVLDFIYGDGARLRPGPGPALRTKSQLQKFFRPINSV